MRWTLSRKLGIALGGLLTTSLIYLEVVYNSASDIEYVHSEVKSEWAEMGHILAIRDVMYGLAQAIEHPEHHTGDRPALIQGQFDLFFEHLGHLIEHQSEETSASTKHQEREWNVIEKTETSMREIEERWRDMSRRGVDGEPQSVLALLADLESLDVNLRAFAAIATKGVDDAVDEIREAHKRISGAIPVLLASLLFILCAVSVGCYFVVVRPIRNLQTAAKRFEGHNFADLPGSSARDEIGDLTRAFAEMAGEIRDSTLDLENQIESRTRELIHGHKLAAAGQLAAGVAHEINNPLAAIGICAEGLLRRLEGAGAGEDSETFREYLETIRDEVLRTRGIIGKLLDFSRPDERYRETVEARALADDALGLAKPTAGQRRVDLVSSYASEAKPLKCNPDQIKQVLLNLLLNAIDASDEGQEVHLSLREQPGHVLFEVKDQGSGIDRGDLDHVFDPFFSRKPQGKGSGLGLAVSYGIVDSHEGEIRAYSSGAGRGARFTVKLPVDLPENAKRPAAPTLPKESPRTS